VKQDKEAMRLKEEYTAREKEAMKKILDRLPEKDWVSPLDFYPELKVRSPYTGLVGGDKPVWVVLPYFANIIVFISSYLSEREFKAIYGLEIDQLLQLQEDGKVSLILGFPGLSGKISDYLLPLYEEGLEKHFPTYLRILLFAKLVGGQALEKGWEEGEKLFRGKLKKIAELGREPRKSVTDVERILEDHSTSRYACLKWFGYDQICEYIKALMKSNIPDLAFIAAHAYGTFLIEPTLLSFDGIHLVNEYDVSALRNVIEHGGSLPPIKARYEVFPFEIGKTLIEKAKLVVPNSLDSALDYYKDFEKARRALAELEMAVYEKEREKLIDRARALEEAWREVESIDAGAKTANKVITTLGVVGSVIGGAFGGLPGLLGGLFGGLVSTDFISRSLGEKLSKIGRSNHIVFVYDFVKSVKKTRGD